MPKFIVSVLVPVVIMVGACRMACAQPAAAAGTGTADPTAEERIAFIEDRLDAERQHAQIWYWGWLTVYSVSTVVQSVQAGQADQRADRANLISQAVLSASGVADVLFRPLEARFGADRIRALPEATPEERARKLERAEVQLRANAERAATRTEWPQHLINAATNIAAGLVVWAAGDGRKGAASALIGTLGGEVYIWTEPSRPLQDLADYERFSAGQPVRAAGGWRVVPQLGGIAVEYRF